MKWFQLYLLSAIVLIQLAATGKKSAQKDVMNLASSSLPLKKRNLSLEEASQKTANSGLSPCNSLFTMITYLHAFLISKLYYYMTFTFVCSDASSGNEGLDARRRTCIVT